MSYSAIQEWPKVWNQVASKHIPLFSLACYHLQAALIADSLWHLLPFCNCYNTIGPLFNSSRVSWINCQWLGICRWFTWMFSLVLFFRHHCHHLFMIWPKKWWQTHILTPNPNLPWTGYLERRSSKPWPKYLISSTMFRLLTTLCVGVVIY